MDVRQNTWRVGTKNQFRLAPLSSIQMHWLKPKNDIQKEYTFTAKKNVNALKNFFYVAAKYRPYTQHMKCGPSQRGPNIKQSHSNPKPTKNRKIFCAECTNK